MSSNTGVVYGIPSKFLRIEAVVLFAFSIWLFAIQGVDWWWYPVLLLVPDVFMVGYLANTTLGAVLYNLGHSTPLALLLVFIGVLTASPFTIALGAIWLGHIGMDRAMGYGLKYHDSFKHTHLSQL